MSIYPDSKDYATCPRCGAKPGRSCLEPVGKAGKQWRSMPTPHYGRPELVIFKAGEVVHLDALVEVCGFFTADTETFGGYGCEHPKQESRDSETGEGQCDDCPLAWQLYPDQEERDAEIMVAAGFEPDNGDGKLRVMNEELRRA